MSTRVPNQHDEHDNSGRSRAQLRRPVDLSELDRECALRGWGKQQLAAAMGVRRETVWQIYANRSTTAKTYGKLRAALEGSPVTDLDVRLMGAPAEAGAA